MFTVSDQREYESILKRLEKLKAEPILDGAEAAEIISLMAAAEEWETKASDAPDGAFKLSDHQRNQ